MSLPYDKRKIPKARQLRKNMTPQERKLWYGFLSSYAIRFQRQKTIDRFIVDFYCHKAKLIVELDGSQHYSDEGIAYDQERSAVLERYGLKVIRFSNRQVDREFYAVCQVIDEEVRRRCGDAPPVSLR